MPRCSKHGVYYPDYPGCPDCARSDAETTHLERLHRYCRRLERENAQLRRDRAELVEALAGLLKLHEAHHNAPEHAAARDILARMKEPEA